jgi:hypothetical protein
MLAMEQMLLPFEETAHHYEVRVTCDDHPVHLDGLVDAKDFDTHEAALSFVRRVGDMLTESAFDLDIDYRPTGWVGLSKQGDRVHIWRGIVIGPVTDDQ